MSRLKPLLRYDYSYTFSDKESFVRDRVKYNSQKIKTNQSTPAFRIIKPLKLIKTFMQIL